MWGTRMCRQAVQTTPLGGGALPKPPQPKKFRTVNPKFATSQISAGPGSWQKADEVWVPEQTELAERVFGQIFHEYFEEVNAITPVQKLKQALYDIRDKKLSHIDSIYAAEILLSTVCRTHDRLRGLPSDVRCTRVGDGWCVSKSVLQKFQMDSFYPLVLRPGLTEKDLKDAARVRSVMYSRGEKVARTALYYEADLIVLVVLTMWKPKYWRELRLRVMDLKSGVPIHPSTMDIVIEAMISRYSTCKDDLAAAFEEGETKRHGALADELQALTSCFYSIPKYLLSVAQVEVRSTALVAGDLSQQMLRAFMGKVCALVPAFHHLAILKDAGVFAYAAGPELVIPIIRQRCDELRDFHASTGQRRGHSLALREKLGTLAGSFGELVRFLSAAGERYFQMPEWQTEEGVHAMHSYLRILSQNDSMILYNRNAGTQREFVRHAIWLYQVLGTTPAGLAFDGGAGSTFCNSVLRAYNAPGGRQALFEGEEREAFFAHILSREDVPPGDPAAWGPVLTLSHAAAPAELHDRLIARFLDVLLDPTSAMSKHSALENFFLSQDPFNTVLGKVKNVEQAVALLQEMRRAGKPINRPNYLSLFARFFDQGRHEEALEVLWRGSGQHEPDDTRATLVMRAAHAMCVVGHQSMEHDVVREAEALLERDLFMWSQKSLPTDGPAEQYKEARPFLAKVLPKMVERLDRLSPDLKH